MSEATIDENGAIECGAWSMTASNNLLYVGKSIYPSDVELEDLYQVLHTWHMAKAYDQKYIKKVGDLAEQYSADMEAKDDAT